MNSDAQEAAMGLLSLSPNNIPPPPAVVPQKRKFPPPQTHHYQNAHGSDHPTKRRSTQRIVVQYHPQSGPENEKEKELEPEPEPAGELETVGEEGDISTESIRCICGSTYDDGFSIACDDCSRWCHAACFGIVEGEVPEEWRCWVCVPRFVDRDHAVKLQKERQRLAHEHLLVVEREKERQRRRMSPGVDRRHRRASTANDGHNNKRKRRASILAPPAPVAPPATHNDDDVDVLVDVDDPWTHSYVPITHDVVPNTATRDHLRRQAQNWRGITAIEPWSPPPIAIQQLPAEDPAVRPPSAITPSAVYLSDPLNAYAHLGMPKPFVHLVGPPLDLALDARISGDKARFVRSGCRPNAVLRPILCPSPRGNGEITEQVDNDETTLGFAVFAARDLKADEEVVLGWEWDDGNVVHSLPALIQSPHMFPPAHYAHLRAQMNNILHLLTSTFTTCACGSRARDCALAQMERFVKVDQAIPPQHRRHSDDEGEPIDLGPLIGRKRGFRTRARMKGSGGMGGVEMWATPEAISEARPSRPREIDGDISMAVDGDETEDEDVPLGRRQEEQWRGQEPEWHHSRTETQKQLRPPDPDPPLPTSVSSTNEGKKGRRREERGGPRRISWDDDPPMDCEQEEVREEKEAWMPPKMRKRWIHREMEALKEMYGSAEGEADLKWEERAKGGADLNWEERAKDGAGMDTFAVEARKGDDVEITDVIRPPALDGMVNDLTVEGEAPAASQEDLQPVQDRIRCPSTTPSFPDTPASPVHQVATPQAPVHLHPGHGLLAPPAASPSESFARLSLASPAIQSAPSPPCRPPLSSLHYSWIPESQAQDSPTMDTLQPQDHPVPPPSAAGDDACPASSPASPDIPPAASPSTFGLALSMVESQPPFPDIQADVEEGAGSPQVLHASWSPLRRASSAAPEEPQEMSMEAEQEKVEEQELSSSPAPASTGPRLSVPHKTGATDYYPELRSDEEIVPPRVAAVEPPSPSISMNYRPERSPSTEPPPPIEIRSPTASPALHHDDSLQSQEPATGVEEPPPTTPGAAPKVKMSLKDFAARRKKRKEEEKVGGTSAGTSVEASPVIIQLGLAADTGVGGEGVARGDGEVTGKPMNHSSAGAPMERRKDEPTKTESRVADTNGTLKLEDVEVSSLPSKPIRTERSQAPLLPTSSPNTPAREPTTTLKAKLELLDKPIPLAAQTPFTPSPRPEIPCTPSPANFTPQSRQPSQEEGEILIPRGDTPPFIKLLPALTSARSAYVPRSRTPPTQPRSFLMAASPPPFSRPPPSGPRALRMSSTFQHPPSARGGLVARPLPSGPSSSSDIDARRHSDYDRDRSQTPRLPPSAPRGPSADRERMDADRDCERPSLVARSRVKPGVGSWGR